MNASDAAYVAQTLVDINKLVDNLLLLLSDKEKTVIKKRFSLENNKKHTLEEIGKEFSVTRERVRQIEKNALSKMKRNVFNTSLKYLHMFVTENVNNSGGLIKEDSLMENFVEMLGNSKMIDENCLKLALVLHDEFECVGNTINFFPYLRSNSLKDYSLKHASKKLINQLHKYGDVKDVESIHSDLQAEFEKIEFDVTRVKSLIDIDKRITLVDDDFVGLMEWRHIHPRTLRDKILFILNSEKEALHFTEIADRIAKAKFDNRPINLQAVHNELIRHEQFVLIGRGIYALADWGYEKGTVVDVIERVLNENDEMTESEIIDAVLDRRQVKRITVQLALKNNDQFERIGRKRYKLKA